MNDTILEQLKARRKALGITQSEMAKRLKITQPQYQKIESSGNPNLKTLSSIALALDMKLLLVPKEEMINFKKAKKPLSLLDQFGVDDP